MSDYEALVTSWKRSLRAENKSPRTVELYLDAAKLLGNFLEEDGHSMVAGEISRSHIDGFIARELDRGAPATANLRYRALQQLFKWLEAEEEIGRNPMRNTKPPRVPVTPPPVLEDDEIRALLAACDGRGFRERRDRAIISLFIDTGMRLAELTNLQMDDVDWDATAVFVVGKGRKPRGVPFGKGAGRALDRYLRARARHRLADLGALWIGRGPMTRLGIAQVVRRVGKAAGLNVHPHIFRHTFAHRWLLEGGQEGDLMELAGWTSRSMLDRYGASARSKRAHEAHRKLSPLDNL